MLKTWMGRLTLLGALVGLIPATFAAPTDDFQLVIHGLGDQTLKASQLVVKAEYHEVEASRPESRTLEIYPAKSENEGQAGRFIIAREVEQDHRHYVLNNLVLFERSDRPRIAVVDYGNSYFDRSLGDHLFRVFVTLTDSQETIRPQGDDHAGYDSKLSLREQRRFMNQVSELEALKKPEDIAAFLEKHTELKALYARYGGGRLRTECILHLLSDCRPNFYLLAQARTQLSVLLTE